MRTPSAPRGAASFVQEAAADGADRQLLLGLDLQLVLDGVDGVADGQGPVALDLGRRTQNGTHTPTRCPRTPGRQYELHDLLLWRAAASGIVLAKPMRGFR